MWWLPHLGWTYARVDGTCRDPWGKPVVGGQFGFANQGRFVRVQKCNGTRRVIDDALNLMKRHNVNALHQVIINLDSDAADGGEGPAERGLDGLPGKLTAIFDGTEPGLLAPNCYRVDGVRVSAIIWRADGGNRRFRAQELGRRAHVRPPGATCFARPPDRFLPGIRCGTN